MTILTPEQQYDWLSKDNHRIILMDLEYHNGTSIDYARFSSYPYVMPINDTWSIDGVPFNNIIYDDIISDIPNIVARIDEGETIGAITLLNTDGEYDWLLDTSTVVGHSIQLSIGQASWIRRKFILILEGVVNSISSNSPETIEITLRDPRENLNVVAQEQLYITNGVDEYWDTLMDAADASASFTGKIFGSQAPYNRSLAVLPEGTENTHVPVCLGKCFNIEPVLIDSWNHIYHIHHSDIGTGKGIREVTEVRANGVPLSLTPISNFYSMAIISYSGGGGDPFLIGEVIEDNTDSNISGVVTGYTGTNGVDFTLFYKYTGVSPAPGFNAGTGTFKGLTSGVRATAVTPTLLTADPQYEVDLLLGMIRLLDHDQGTQITCDVIGQDGASSSKFSGLPVLTGYSAADIIEWLLIEKTDISHWLDICYNTFAAYSVFVYDPSNTTTEYMYTTSNNGLDLSATYIASIEIARDQTPRTTRFPLFRLSFHSTTYESHDVALDTKTGEISNAVIGTVENLGNFWRVTITASNVHPLNDTVRVQYYPAAGASATWAYSDTTLGGQYIQNPSLVTTTDTTTNILLNHDDYTLWSKTSNLALSGIPTRPFENTYPMGLYYKSETTVLELITKIINSVGGFLRFELGDCKIQLIQLEDPEGMTPHLTLTDDDIIENGVSLSILEEPKKSITLGYKKNWKTQDEGSLAGALTDASSPYYDMNILTAYKNEYSTIYAEPAPALDPVEYPLSEDVDLIETTIWDKTDAQTELARRLELRGQRRRVLRVQSLATSFTYGLGDIVHIINNRYGLSGGKEAMIIGIEENPLTGRVTLDVWL